MTQRHNVATEYKSLAVMQFWNGLHDEGNDYDHNKDEGIQ